MLYDYILHPLILLMEMVLQILYEITSSYGVAIILLAVVTRIALIPVGRYAARVVRWEYEIQGVIAQQIKQYKERLKGKELHDATSRLYRRYGYHPLYSVRALSGLLVQVPFLIAAFYMLTGLEAIQGVSFLGIASLGRPDAMLNGMNLLPFGMLAVSLLASWVGAEMSKRDRVQNTLISLAFFVLLYSSPSALILYWTTSNFITLLAGKLNVRSLWGKFTSSFLPHDCPQAEFQKMDFSKSSSFYQYVAVVRDYIKDQSYELSLVLNLVVLLLALNEVATVAGQGKFFLGFKPASLILPMLALVMTAVIIIRHFPKRKNAAAVALVLAASAIVFVVFFDKLLMGGAALLLIFVSSALAATNIPARNLKTTNFIYLSYGGVLAGAVFNWLNNMDIFIPITTLQFFLIAGIAAFLVVLLAYPFVKAIPYTNIIAVLGAAYLLTFVIKPTLHFMLHGSHFEEFLVGFILSWLFLALVSKKRIANGYVVLILFVLSSTFTGGTNERSMAGQIDQVPALEKNIQERIKQVGLPKVPDSTPNIYFLAAESVPNLESLERIGVPTNEFRKLLAHFNFKIYPNALSLGYDSLRSTSMAFEITNVEVDNKRLAVGGMSFVNRWLQSMGYTTTFIGNDYLTHRYNYYDRRLPQLKTNYFAELSNFIGGVAKGKFSLGLFFDESYDLEAVKKQYLDEIKSTPSFVYFHGMHPGHSPNTGVCRPDEVALYAKRLETCLGQLEDDLQRIVKNDPEAIIIISGDHGPYLLETCTGIPERSKMTRAVVEDRWGAIEAIRWPDPQKASHFDGDLRLRQNIFPTLFSYLYNSKVPLALRLPNKLQWDGATLWENGKFVPPSP